MSPIAVIPRHFLAERRLGGALKVVREGRYISKTMDVFCPNDDIELGQ